MTTEETIKFNAERLLRDAKALDAAIDALTRNGAPPRLVSDVAKRRDEWEQQAEDMREGLDEDEADEPLPPYTNPDHQQFVADMEGAGLTVEHYHGRFYWTGPAVRVDELQEAMSHTKVPVQYDGMGLGYIVYPRA